MSLSFRVKRAVHVSGADVDRDMSARAMRVRGNVRIGGNWRRRRRGVTYTPPAAPIRLESARGVPLLARRDRAAPKRNLPREAKVAGSYRSFGI